MSRQDSNKPLARARLGPGGPAPDRRRYGSEGTAACGQETPAGGALGLYGQEKAVGGMPACFLMGKIRNENESIGT